MSIIGEPIFYAKSLSPEFKSVRIIPVSDLHYGNHLFSFRHFERCLKFIDENENVYMVLNGDLCESSLRSSKGDIYKQVGSPQNQRDWIIEKFLPRKHRILGMTTGNHEQRIYYETGIDISKDIAAALNIPYRAEGIILKLSFGNNNNRVDGRPYTYWIYATHGYGGARTAAAKAIKVERTADFVHAHVYIMSHDHTVNVASKVYLIADNRTHIDSETGFELGSVKAWHKKLVKSNAFLKWGGYSEMGGFPPVSLEPPEIIFSGEGRPHVRVLS